MQLPLAGCNINRNQEGLRQIVAVNRDGVDFLG